jgi:hypothetical protein
VPCSRCQPWVHRLPGCGLCMHEQSRCVCGKLESCPVALNPSAYCTPAKMHSVPQAYLWLCPCVKWCLTSLWHPKSTANAICERRQVVASSRRSRARQRGGNGGRTRCVHDTQQHKASRLATCNSCDGSSGRCSCQSTLAAVGCSNGAQGGGEVQPLASCADVATRVQRTGTRRCSAARQAAQARGPCLRTCLTLR